ncbi:hypothetical protein K435DRAFT_774830 [Dendrothele bispora CBS 962.96]|uniref:DUF6699 domain-containing protein n=1 Tax=Dendrothele bispora (strain CBS 962.96) TaxID=1314807 RepID=A0A4S8MLM5_DENBC|nr:hypothetical protein K435DRAFT_774830 [Dendrothele bispora CBS 962.96]
MSGRRVRFAPWATLFPSHSTRSSGSRDYALPFSRRRRTHTSGFYPSLSSPSYASRHPRIHNLLTYSRHPIFEFDVSLPPATMTSHFHLSHRAMYEPAIEPPVTRLTLTIPSISWPITVRPSANSAFITVADVFDGIYRSLRVQVTQEEYRSIRSPSDLKRVNRAYEHRYGSIRDSYAAYKERQTGVRRVDFLVRHTRFRGISFSESRGGFTLHLS